VKAVVYLGPSLPVDEAREIVAACYRPPAAMGDIWAVVDREQPDAIGLIDGYFDSVPAVWHKEILFALSRGVRVLGASSMGALRAAELADFGMEGVGWVYEAFRTGVLEDDDEVAITHGDAGTGYRNLSTAMVNIRVGLARACDRGLVSSATRDAMVELAKRRFYPERSWVALMRDAVAFGLPPNEIDRLNEFVELNRPDVKRDDARALLEQLADGTPPGVTRLRSEVTRTIFWDTLTRTERRLSAGPAGAVRAEEVRRFAKATDEDLAGVLRDALLIHLVQRECEARHVEVTQEQFDAAVRGFRLRHHLTSAQSMRSWLERAGLTREDFASLMRVEAQIQLLLTSFVPEVDERLLDALALRGDLAATIERHVGRSQVATQLSPLERVASDLEVETFYRERIREFDGTLHQHARELGFESRRELLDEVRKIFEATDS